MIKKTKKNYRAWQIDEKDFPKNGTKEEKIKFLIGYGVLAPSTHNTQPWTFKIASNQLIIKPNSSRSLKIGDPESLGLYISLGACVENILQAAGNFGMDSHLDFIDSKVALSFIPKNTKSNPKTFVNIKSRHSHKFPYNSKPIPKTILGKLENISNYKTEVHIIAEKDIFSKVVNLHLESAKTVSNDQAFVLELVNWLRANNTKSYDGMPGFVVGNGQFKSVIGKVLLKRKPELLKKMSEVDKLLLDSSSAIVIFSTRQKTPDKKAMIEAGQTVEKLWLKATEYGLVAHPMFASIQHKPSSKKLTQIIGTNGTPVFLMRIGYSSNKQFHTPRHNKIMRSTSVSKIEALERLAASLKSNPKSSKITIGKYEINYITVGKGEPVLLLHGANIGWAQWHLNVDELAKNQKVYALDLPGAGDSTNVNFRKTKFEKDFAEIVDKFISALKFKKIDIVGSSFGGWIAMRLAIKQRPYINKLIVTNPIGFTTHMPMKFRPISIWPFAVLLSKTALRPKRGSKAMESFMRDVFFDKELPLKSEFIDYFYELSAKSHNVLFISRLAHFSGMRKELFLGDDLKKIRVPTLVIWGLEDPLMPYKTVKSNFVKIPNVKIELLKKVGHMPPVEAPEVVNRAIIKFLTEKV